MKSDLESLLFQEKGFKKSCKVSGSIFINCHKNPIAIIAVLTNK